VVTLVYCSIVVVVQFLCTIVSELNCDAYQGHLVNKPLASE
jgi:EAL domain-containing protein (putative c-di-GMP-specific phosphodiesterase class I)